MAVLTVAVAATFTGMAVLGLAACAQPASVPGSAVPVTTSEAGIPPPTTTVPPPVTVFVTPPVTVTVPEPAPVRPKLAQTPCQWLKANGYSYEFALLSWADEGFPATWDADRDGYPCEQSYGNQN
ncbi:MAG: hypothetical protein WBA97_35940 [Actinophytocola sp.]|uniref:hypothetical protein n=1 Tax=Actinophytocola sp. TaxID=1872138 RepID=UPI003C72E13E